MIVIMHNEYGIMEVRRILYKKRDRRKQIYTESLPEKCRIPLDSSVGEQIIIGISSINGGEI